MMSQAQMSVFISVTHILTPAQESFTGKVEQFLLSRQIQPVTVGRSFPTSPEVMDAIRKNIEMTNGTIVLAFKRFHVESLYEYRNEGSSTALPSREIPSIWNHIEGAMTIQADHPLMMLLEEGVYMEGILNPQLFPGQTFDLNSIADALPQHIESAMAEWLASLET